MLAALGGCDAIFAEEEAAPPPTAATVAPMPSPSEIVVPAPTPAELPPAAPWEVVDAGVDGAVTVTADGGPSVDGGRTPTGPGAADNVAIRNALYPRMVDGRASLDELRMLVVACTQIADKQCRDRANEALKKKAAAQ